MFPKRLLARIEAKSHAKNWIDPLLKFPAAALARIAADEKKSTKDTRWFSGQALARLSQFRRTLVRFTPWMLPDFADLRAEGSLSLPRQDVKLKDLPDLLTRLATRLHVALESASPPASRDSLERLLSLVSGARMDCVRLIQDLQLLAADAGKLHWLNVAPPPGVSWPRFLLGAPFNLWMGVIGGTVMVMSSVLVRSPSLAVRRRT